MSCCLNRFMSSKETARKKIFRCFFFFFVVTALCVTGHRVDRREDEFSRE